MIQTESITKYGGQQESVSCPAAARAASPVAAQRDHLPTSSPAAGRRARYSACSPQESLQEEGEITPPPAQAPTDVGYFCSAWSCIRTSTSHRTRKPGRLISLSP
eukprot:762497-Hanusia_phi.AAC.9